MGAFEAYSQYYFHLEQVFEYRRRERNKYYNLTVGVSLAGALFAWEPVAVLEIFQLIWADAPEDATALPLAMAYHVLHTVISVSVFYFIVTHQHRALEAKQAKQSLRKLGHFLQGRISAQGPGGGEPVQGLYDLHKDPVEPAFQWVNLAISVATLLLYFPKIILDGYLYFISGHAISNAWPLGVFCIAGLLSARFVLWGTIKRWSLPLERTPTGVKRGSENVRDKP